MAKLAPLKLIKKGAEASLFLADWHGRQVIVKSRLPKTYRPVQLDLTIRRYRTVHEPQLMNDAKRAGVLTPAIFMVDVADGSIVMEFIEGKQVKQVLSGLSGEEQDKLSFIMGDLVARLHLFGLIHGDLTTSNMMMDCSGRVFLIDFGLGEKSMELEARGVDLHLLKRALQSTHFEIADKCFAGVLRGYSAFLGRDIAGKVMEKVKEIEKRGRYVDARKKMC
jgi:TP53 regulating kinase-like protein